MCSAVVQCAKRLLPSGCKSSASAPRSSASAPSQSCNFGDNDNCSKASEFYPPPPLSVTLWCMVHGGCKIKILKRKFAQVLVSVLSIVRNLNIIHQAATDSAATISICLFVHRGLTPLTPGQSSHNRVCILFLTDSIITTLHWHSACWCISKLTTKHISLCFCAQGTKKCQCPLPRYPSGRTPFANSRIQKTAEHHNAIQCDRESNFLQMQTPMTLIVFQGTVDRINNVSACTLVQSLIDMQINLAKIQTRAKTNTYC